jgi:hypothetical protein
MGNQFKKTSILYETVKLKYMFLNDLKIHYLPHQDLSLGLITQNLELFRNNFNSFNFKVHEYRHLNGKRFHPKSALGHPFINSGFTLNNFLLDLQLTHNLYINSNFELLLDFDPSGKPRPQFVSADLYLFDKDWLVTKELPNDKVDDFLKNVENRLFKIYENAFNKALKDIK